MGSQRDGDGDRPPEGGPPEGLPDLPPEWGVVIIPNDLSELEEEAARIRRDLRRRRRRESWRRRMRLPARRGPGEDSPALGLPLLIMAVAIVAAVTSLFTITLSGRLDHQGGTANASPPVAGPATVPEVTLRDASGAPVPLRNTLPAVILLVAGCTCGELVDQTVAAAPSGVNVLAVATTAPTITLSPGSRVRLLADPQNTLSDAYRAASPSPNSATAILVRGNGDVVFADSGVTSVAAFRTELAQLAG